MADTTAHEAEQRQTDDANAVDAFARSQRGGVDRSTYWARWLTYWNIIRPTWPVFVAILFVWAVAFGTDQGREAVKFTMTLSVGGVGAAPDFISWLFQDGMLRAYATAAALFMFSVGAHEVFWRATSRDYPFTRRALADLKARFMIGWFVGLSVPVSFFIFYLHHLADVASANVVVEMAGRSDVTQEARAEIIQDWRVDDGIVNAVLLGLIGLIAVSAIYDVINRPFRHLFVNAVRPVERVVLGAFPFIIVAIGFLFFWNTFIAPLVSIADSMSRGFELRALNISATQPARTGAFLTFGTIVLTGGLIRFMHRMSARRYYSNSHQFLVFRKIHNVSMWAALFVFFTVVALYAIKPAFLASLFGPVFTLLVIVGVLVLAFTLLAVYSSHTSGLPSIIMVAALMWVGPSFGSVKFHDLDVQRAYTRLSDDAKQELLSRLPEVSDKVGQDYIQQGVMPLEARVRDWRLAEGRSDNHPAVVVLAEGGGIRAALHTASLLACLDEVYSGELYDNILVLSGVSGGAVGVSTYLAARADGLGTADAEQGAFCQFKANAQPTALTSSVQMNAAGVGQFLQSDFFSPALAGLIFRDFPMDIFPLCAIKQWCSKSDRAQMFERAFEDAYTNTRGDKGRLTNWFGAPFNVVIEEASQIQDGAAKHRLPQPIVLLNTFDAKSGHHAVVSNATFAADRNQPEKNLNGPVNILDYLAGETCEAPSTVSLATAAHLSARFPLVSPPGRLPLDKCRMNQDAVQRRMGLYVDGGITTIPAQHPRNALWKNCADRIRERVRIKRPIVSDQ